jgi:Icc-related predicted phosphoesterase
LRVAAAADIHAREGDAGRLHALVRDVAQDADVLVLGGDLTDLGRLEQAEVLLEAFDDCSIPVIATLGNHDYESGNAEEISRLLAESRVHLLDRSSVVIDGVGFSGVKGFGGGFDGTLINSFGEGIFKAFVSEGILESEALKNELRELGTERRVAVLHYAPIRETVVGESPEIYAFLGTSRLGAALDDGGAAVAFHGHAHNGAFKGETPGGVPVFNVSLPVLEQVGLGKPYHVVEV